MPDDLELEDDENESRTVTLNRDQIRALENKAKKADEFEVRATAAERKLAFAAAGISVDDPRQAYFVKGYDGEVSPEAIRTAATEAGFLEAPDADADQVALDQMARTAAGTRSNSGTITPDDVAGWSMQQRVAFSKNHPDKWETLKQGVPVPV